VHTRRVLPLAVAAAIAAVAVGAVGAGWWASKSPGAEPRPPQAAPAQVPGAATAERAQQGTGPNGAGIAPLVRDFTYAGVARGSFPLLEQANYVCLGTAQPPPADLHPNKLGADEFTHPDAGRRATLTGIEAEIYDCLLTCLPGNHDDWDAAAVSWATACINHQLVEITRRTGSKVSFVAVGHLLHDHPELDDTCHEGGHRAGELAVTELGESYAETMAHTGRMCLGGLQHGVLDAFGYTGPPLEAFAPLVAACSSHAEPPDCAHGLGHAAWDSFGEFDISVEACAGFAAVDLFRQCSHGITMRYFDRMGEPGNLSDLDWLLADAEDICTNRWRDGQTVHGYSLRSGCWYGVGYATWFPVFNSEHRGGDPAALASEVRRVSQLCQAFPPEGIEVCDQQIGRYMAYTSDWNTDKARVLCTYIVGDVERCQREAETNIFGHTNRGPLD
jgi:hypothetical protein